MTELPVVRASRIPVTDTFHGVDVTEDYRWLEDGSSAEAIAWMKAQRDRSRAYFGGMRHVRSARRRGPRRRLRLGIRLAKAFKRHHGTAPGAYRRQAA